MAKTRILVADEHPIVAEGVRSLLGANWNSGRCWQLMQTTISLL